MVNAAQYSACYLGGSLVEKTPARLNHRSGFGSRFRSKDLFAPENTARSRGKVDGSYSPRLKTMLSGPRDKITAAGSS